MQWLLDILSGVLLFAGCFFVITSSIGLLRMPDIFTRIHAASLADTLGAILIATGLMLQSGFSLATAKLILIVIFILFTSPVASYALARAALQAGIKPEKPS